MIKVNNYCVFQLDHKKEKEKNADSREQENTPEDKRLEAPQKMEEPHSPEPPRVEPDSQSPQKTEMPSESNRHLDE